MKNVNQQETAPLTGLDQWEDDVLERYPEPGVPAKSKEEFRNYDKPENDGVREFYRLNHKYQTYDNVLAKKSELFEVR